MNIPSQYRDMLKDALREERANSDETTKRPQKRRRKRGENALSVEPDPLPNVRSTASEPEKPRASTKVNHERMNKIMETLNREQQAETVDIEDIDYRDKTQPIDSKEESNKKPIEISSVEEESTEEEQEASDFDTDAFDSDDFEDVDLSGEPELPASKKIDNDSSKETLHIKFRKTSSTKQKKARPTVITSEERIMRRSVHVLYLFAMVGHGLVRNKWCSEETLLERLRTEIPNSLKREYMEYEKFRKDGKSTTISKTRRLLDLLRHLMSYWNSVWTNDSDAPFIYKKTWSEIASSGMQKRDLRPVKFDVFFSSITSHFGSRDISAQGFCALLRSLNLPARLVFSLQPPDFTNMIEAKVLESRIASSSPVAEDLTKKQKPKKLTQHERLLDALKPKKKAATNSTKAKDSENTSSVSALYPVFWVEVWDKDAKKYVTIDPCVKKFIEVVTNKSRLEPPMNCRRNNTWYVIGYDRLGGARDITRRYSKEFNAKTRKKRIDRELRYQSWYTRLIAGACSEKRVKDNKIDKFEEIDMEEFSQREGMPASITDFKGHPVYVLEADLRWNEILDPMVSCGTVRKKTKYGADGELIPVYKRSNVLTLKSAKGWFMKGRVLKIGERPLKIYKRNSNKRKRTEDQFQLSDGDNEDDGGRLYAEKQTEKYIPPPITNGKIPRNAYKNIDIYEPWMVPKGCVHIKDKESDKAAKVMGIEFVPAVVGFDFEGHKQKRTDVKVKILGIVTFEEYEEAVLLVASELREQKNDQEQRKKDLLILRNWKVFLTKLQIKNRLNRMHGDVISTDEEENSNDYDEEEREKKEDEEEEFAGYIPSVNNIALRTRSQVIPEENVNMSDLADSDLEISDFDENVSNVVGKREKTDRPMGIFQNGSANTLSHGGENKDEEFEYDPSENENEGKSSDLPDEFDDFMNEIEDV